MTEDRFRAAFAALTGNESGHFPWQWALYQRFVAGDFPPCNLPTGLGKTSVVAIWLIALTNHLNKMPRRLVYVVNRRTVVDQTTDEVVKLRQNLRQAGLEKSLQGFCALPLAKEELPLAISTLRGQFADNREWSADPSRPAVIVGTVDMIGSRLLFSGYGVGFKAKPLHAGFLGQDVLLVHDEAHLEPAFQELLVAIQNEQERCKEFGKFRVMELSATSRTKVEPFTLTQRDHENPIVVQRIEAKKAIQLHENKDSRKLADEIAILALGYRDSGRAVLVFVRKVDDVEKIVAKLGKEKQKVQQLTGTLRGMERDQLVDDAIFARFLPASNRPANVTPTEGTVFLVCTSAGEVGVNISGDHLVCDLSTFESMAQRFGRVNRFGERDDTRIEIIYPKVFDQENELEVRLQRTLDLLGQLNSDGSPKALEALKPDDRLAAFSPQPMILSVSDILFDAWALTTVRDKLPGRPPVEPYLHGLSSELPETHVAWREEVGVIIGDLLETYKPRDLLEDYPLKPHELLRDNSSRVFDRLRKLFDRRNKANAPDPPVWVVTADDSVSVTTLGKLIEMGKDTLAYQTILLPPSGGGLENGMLASDSDAADDVADDWYEDKEGKIKRRVRVWDGDPIPDGMRLIRAIDTKPEADETEDEERAGRRFWRWNELSKAGDTEGSKSGQKPVLWQVHTDDVVKNTIHILERLQLSDDLKQAVLLAAKFHDLGKRRSLFQKILGNFDPGMLLAKSGKKSGRVPELYRHEFGSLLDLLEQDDFRALKDRPDLQDLVLHMVAAHHGYGRPHFPPDRAFDPESNGKDASKIAAEVPQRFARLQRKYGRWGLAYLESLLRAADYAASANPSAFAEDQL